MEAFKKPINRMQYFERILPVAVIYVIFTNGHWVPSEFHWAVVLIIIGSLVLRCVFASQRLRDIGQSPWLALLTLIPIFGLVVGIYCLAARGAYDKNTETTVT
jgi:uncharacterized membrane protein YhaH (DUF805 family)